MAWIGYYTYDGTEIINVDRVEKYIGNQRASWGLKNRLGTGSLPSILQETYDTPLVDGAPWTDPDRMDSYDFWGAYPINVAGVEDSTRESAVVEYIGNGGSVGALRHATRPVVFSVALFGASEAAVDYGMNWLKAALLGRNCSPRRGCSGAELAYFASEPLVDPYTPDIPPDVDPVLALLDGGRSLLEVDEPDIDGGTSSTVFVDEFDGGAADTDFPIILSEPYPEPFVANPPEPQTDPTGCLTALLRRLKEVKINDGPDVTSKRIFSDGSVMWTVSFTATAGDPFEYGRDRVVVDRFLGADTTDPFGPDITGVYDSVGFAHTDTGCPPKVFEAIYDPLCPALVAPPGPVDIPAGCFDPENEWWRRYITLPADLVPQWGSSVPVIGVTAQYEDLRQVRLRLYAGGVGFLGLDIDECSPVGDLMVTYVPQGMTLIIDGVKQAVYVVDLDGVQRRADSLVFSSDGKPIVWPELICGDAYLLTVDTVTPAVFPEVDLNLIAKAA